MQTEGIFHRKSEIRLKARAARRALMPEERAVAAAAVCLTVMALPEMRDVSSVLLYGAMPEEVDVTCIAREMRERGARVAMPRVAGPHDLTLHWIDDESELVEGSFGLREPRADAPRARLDEIEAIIVPAVAFDVEGWRIGLGRGYYDRLLARVADGVPTIGVAYDEQVFPAVPRAEHDRPVRILVTPTRTVRAHSS
ncbi:MAG: 5-formyltetrahydrofolate cyclo-ligase [Coriobacteriia bacterium]